MQFAINICFEEANIDQMAPKQQLLFVQLTNGLGIANINHLK
jgi:hypothetical protein